MTNMNRREAMLGMLGMAATPYIAPGAAWAQDDPLPLTAIPPEGIGHNISHVSYSDVGGHPDTVQVMVNRNHLYVGHMFHSGVTILDASDPRNLKVNYLSILAHLAASHSALVLRSIRGADFQGCCGPFSASGLDPPLPAI